MKIDKPTIIDFTNAGHDHSDASKGGNIPWTSITGAPTGLPAPYLQELVPDTYLPSTTGNFLLRGSFFTEDMSIVVEGHTINYITYINDNEVRINLTTSATEGSYDITLNNGTEATFTDVLQVVNGTVYEPISSDWNTIVEPINLTESGKAQVKTFGSAGSAKLNFVGDVSTDFSINLSGIKSPLGTPPSLFTGDKWFKITDLVSGDYWEFSFYYAVTSGEFRWTINGGARTDKGFAAYNFSIPIDISLEWDGVNLYWYAGQNGILNLIETFTVTEFSGANNVDFQFITKHWDLVKIKYIDLSDTSGTTIPNYLRISQFINDVPYVKVGKRITNAAVTTTYNLDHDLATDWKLTLTGDTTFTESNLPTGTNTIEFTIKMTGEFALTFPTYWDVLGDTYDGAVWNFMAVQIHDGNSGTEEATVFISNM